MVIWYYNIPSVTLAFFQDALYPGYTGSVWLKRNLNFALLSDFRPGVDEMVDYLYPLVTAQ